MALFITKPILWNHQGYKRPSGVKANSGWPKDHGFGHEEWNGSPALSYKADGVAYRLFHTEGIGNAPFEEEAGRINRWAWLVLAAGVILISTARISSVT